MSNELQYLDLEPPTQPGKWGEFHPDPVYYYNIKNKKEYLLVFPHCDDDSSIHKYDIAENSWSNNTDYRDFKMKDHDVVIDNETNTLYTLGSKCFNKMDLEQYSWIDSGRNAKYNLVATSITALIYCQSPIQQLHAFVKKWRDGDYQYNHVRFDSKSQKFVKYQSNINFADDLIKMIYLQHAQKFMVFCGHGIYECGVKKNQIEYHWNKLKLEIPEVRFNGDCFIRSVVSAFGDQIIFLFTKNTRIFCLDLEFNEWVVCNDKSVKFRFVYHMNICLANDYAYFLECYKGIYFRIKLSDMLPTKLKKRHIERDQAILSGYIASCKKSLSAEIPSDLLCLLLRFTSEFLNNLEIQILKMSSIWQIMNLKK